MLLGALLGLLNNVWARNDSPEARFVEKLSLLHPHVAENGRNPFYSFEENYLIFTRTKQNYTQLGYNKSDSVGLIKSKEPIKMRSFKISVDFQITPVQGGGKYGFWISDDIKSGKYYGRNQEYAGVGVVIDTSKRPFATVVSGDGSIKGATVHPSFGNGVNTLTIEARGKRVIITLFIGGREYMLYTGPAPIQPTHIFGITAFTGEAATPMIFHSIHGYALTSTKLPYVKGETAKSRGVVVLLGVVSVGGLIYYLYQKQSKEKEFRLKG